MKVGIDSYCYHRYFGEIYPDQPDPGVRWSFHDFVRRAGELGVDDVSLESCFFESLEPGYLAELGAVLDEHRLSRVLAWGHPDGLEAGRNEEAWRQMNALIPKAVCIGAGIMRIVASSLMFRFEPHAPQIEAIVRMLKQSAKIARDHGVILALENHIDYTSAEILEILERVDSDALKVNFDTGNTLRMMEDPVAAARRLGPLHCRHAHQGRGGLPACAARGVVLLFFGARGHRADRYPGGRPGAGRKRIPGRAGRRIRSPQGQPGRGPARRAEYRIFESARCRAIEHCVGTVSLRAQARHDRLMFEREESQCPEN